MIDDDGTKDVTGGQRSCKLTGLLFTASSRKKMVSGDSICRLTEDWRAWRDFS